MGALLLTYFLLMTLSYSLRRTINPLKIRNISYTGTVLYQGSVLTSKKSDLYCSPNMTNEDQTSLALSLHVNLVKTPSKYLGLDFKLRGKKVADFHFLVDKLTSKLQG